MTRYYKLKHWPGWYYKVEGKNAWCIYYPPGWHPEIGRLVSADALIKNCELIELTKEEVFLELL